MSCDPPGGRRVSSAPVTATLRETPLHARHVALGARMVPFAGWSMPVQYRGVIEEHRAVRGGAGVFDVSHMGRFAVTRGAHAHDDLQGLPVERSRRHRAG